MTYRELSYMLATNFAVYRLFLTRMQVREQTVHVIDIREL